jgi:chromosome segregation ATPase
MKKVVALEVTAQTGQVEQSVGNIRKELKGAKSELIAAQATFGDYSKEALAAAKRVAQLKDQIAEANETAQLFDPGNKFAAFAGALNAVAGGFAAVQGAQALLGSESEELAKTLAKVQGALALSQGLSAVADSAKDFNRLAAVVKGPVIAAFTTLRGAIIATGIGALAVGIGLIIANFDKLKNSSGIIGKIFRGIGDAIEFVTGKIEDLTDWLGITASAEEEAAARTKAAAERQKNAKEAAYNAELAIARATGKGVEEIEARKRKEVLKTLETQSLQLRLLKSVFGDSAPAWIGDALANIEVELTKVRTEQKVAEIEQKKKQDSDAKAAASKRASDAKQAADELKRKKDEAEKQRQQELEQRQKLEDELRRERMTEADRELADVQAQYNQRVMLAKGNADLLVQIERSRDEQIRAIRDKFNLDEDNRVIVERKVVGQQIDLVNLRLAAEKASADLRKRLKDEEERQQNERLAAYKDFANNLIDIVGRQSTVGKALAIATATIDTYQAANSALKANYGVFGPVAQVARFVAVAATIARGIRNVRQIAATRVPGVGGGGGGSVSAPNISVPAPIAPQAQTTQLDQSSINAVGNAAAGRAFVLNTDIQNNQERIARLNRAARIN